MRDFRARGLIYDRETETEAGSCDTVRCLFGFEGSRAALGNVLLINGDPPAQGRMSGKSRCRERKTAAPDMGGKSGGAESMKEMRLGFIGFGNMARAMADGLLLKGAVKPEQIYACAKHYEKLCGAAEARGIHPCRDARETAENADMVIVAVKPYLVAEVLEPVREILQEKIVISVAAGYPFDRYESVLLPGTHHLSTIPNTPVSVGEGIIVCEEKHSLTEEEFAVFSEIFSQIGLVQTVPTAQLGVAGDLSGCGPAFAAMFIEALADGAVLHGLPRELAYRLASQMIVGTGKLQQASGSHPGAMKDAVCSPGGTTITGVAALEQHGFRSAVISALDAVRKKQM